MQRPDDPEGRTGRLVLSAGDLAWYSRCAHRTTMDRAELEGADYERGAIDDFAAMLIARGNDHEVAYLKYLQDFYGPDAVVDCSAGDLETQVAATLQAFADEVPVVFQAALLAPDPGGGDVWWEGHVDFAVRNSNGVYEPHDTKLGSNDKSWWPVQLAAYATQLGHATGVSPDHGAIVSPNGDGFQVAPVNLTEVDVDGLRRSVVAATTGPTPGTLPDRKGACSECVWSHVCSDTRQRERNLTLVHGIRANQVAALRAGGVNTIDELAACFPAAIPEVDGVSAEVASKLAHQAHAQVETERTGGLYVEVVNSGADGLGKLPDPSPGDLYFDIEGTKMLPEPLEYLHGVGWIHQGRFQFEAIWATGPDEEKEAFERLVLLLTDRLEKDPRAHIYHYNHYEGNALKQLADRHGVHSDAVNDVILPAMVDLYKVVTKSLVVGAGKYGLKSLEPLYRSGRDADVTDALSSIVEFHRFLEANDQSILSELETYNRDDVESTWQLHEWLLTLR